MISITVYLLKLQLKTNFSKKKKTMEKIQYLSQEPFNWLYKHFFVLRSNF